MVISNLPNGSLSASNAMRAIPLNPKTQHLQMTANVSKVYVKTMDDV